MGKRERETETRDTDTEIRRERRNREESQKQKKALSGRYVTKANGVQQSTDRNMKAMENKLHELPW